MIYIFLAKSNKKSGKSNILKTNDFLIILTSNVSANSKHPP